MENRRTLRIVLASPGDVTAERDVVGGVVAELDGICRDMDPPLAWELWRWETDAYPGLHLEGPQGIIDERLRIDQSDVLVGIFRRRFGTPVADADSGTEHEIRSAINAWKTRGAPRVMIYFAEDPADQNTPQDDEQWHKVQRFKRELMEEEKALVGSFHDLASFERQISSHLLKFAFQLHADSATRAGLKNGLVRVSWRPELVHLRAEGLTELLGTFFLEMTYEGRNPPTSPLYVSVQIYLNMMITSRPRDPVLFEVGRPGADVYLSTTDLYGNHLVFPAFRLDGMLPGEKRTFQISNLRCNATHSMPAIQAFVTVAGGIVEKEQQLVATIGEGLRFEVTRSEGQERRIGGVLRQSAKLPPTRVATLRFTEGFRNAFKVQMPVYGGSPPRNDGAVAYGSESGLFGMALSSSSGQAVLSNLADFGTRLMASFHLVPTGVRLFVTDSPDGTAALIEARLVKSESTVGADNCEIEGRTACELVVREGSAVAVWQMISSGPDRRWSVAALDFGVFAAYVNCSKSNSPMPGATLVNGTFSPTPPPDRIGGFSLSSSVLPIPRFRGPYVPAAELFRIVFE
jgi:hypothetical protein